MKIKVFAKVLKRIGNRHTSWDNANTEQLIAELKARGFKVIRNNIYYDIQWGE